VGGDGEAVIQGLARIVTEDGMDVTAEYLCGAHRSLRIGLQAGCRRAVLKQKSPACGAGTIYDGSFSACLTQGDGVLAALLKRYGFDIVAV